MSTIKYGEDARDLTWQTAFPSETPCVKCGKRARLAFALREEEGEERYVANLHRNNWQEGNFWLHDAGAFATYICSDVECATATTLWNQA